MCGQEETRWRSIPGCGQEFLNRFLRVERGCCDGDLLAVANTANEYNLFTCEEHVGNKGVRAAR